jgi:hypothetical protein
VPALLALGFINWIVGKNMQSLRSMQMYDLWGGSIFTIVHIVLQGINFGLSGTNLLAIATTMKSIVICRYFFAAFWLLLWLTSVQLWLRFSECDFSMMQPLSGKYGVGVKSAFAKDGCHILIHYPVEKENYETAIKSEFNRAIW